MKVIKTVLILGIGILIALSAQAQDDGNYEYNREFIWGINKNTNGGLIGGFIIKNSKAIGPRTFRTIGGEIMNVKHPKEDRKVSRRSGNTFIWGKSNYLYAFRFYYGFDRILFKKAPQQGVQINYGVAAGPTIGVLAPYYIEVLAGGRDGVSREQYDPFNSRHNFSNILGTGRLFQGLGKSKIKPGLNAKAALTFEFGTFKSNVTGFEVGLNAEAYTEKIILIPAEKNRAVFTSAFITLFYGSRR